MTVKKVFEPIVALLTQATTENPKVKVADLMEQIIALASAKVNRGEGRTFIKDASGAVVAIHDYYFKRWMPLVGPSAVEFGAKAKTSTGFNTMCKAGVSLWTKQQRVADDANKQILKDLKDRKIQASDIDAIQAQIEVDRKAIAPTDLGFVSEDEVRAYLVSNGVTLTA